MQGTQNQARSTACTLPILAVIIIRVVTLGARLANPGNI